MNRRRSDLPRTPRTLLGAVFAGALLMAPAVHGLAPEEVRASSLAVSASSWALPSRPVSITVRQAGVLAGRHLAIYVFVDGNLVQRITTSSNETGARIQVPELAVGRHRLTVRAGTESAETEFRILSGWLVLGGSALLLVEISLVALHLRKRR
ncbi:MAG: hypothetical protein ABI639_10305, partial [Thermoanaerobaculia bacterium]